MSNNYTGIPGYDMARNKAFEESIEANVAKADTSAFKAAISEANALQHEITSLALSQAYQNGVTSYVDAATLKASKPATIQVGRAADTGLMYYWSGTAWTDLEVTLEDWAKDLKVFGDLVTSSAASVTDRKGVVHKTWSQLQKEFMLSGGALGFTSLAELRAYVPEKSNVIAQDTSTGKYYLYSNSAWTLSKYQPSQTADGLVNLNLAVHSLANNLSQVGLDELPKAAEADRLAMLYATSITASALAPLDGFDPDAQSSGGSGTAGSALKYPDIYAFGEPRGLIRVDVTGDSGVPTSKDNPITGKMRIDIDGEVFESYISYKVQGASSAAWPKKNMKFEMFSDAAMTSSVSLKIGDTAPKDKYIFKANWIDTTHVRNVMCYDLWDKVMESRKGWPQRDIDNTYVGQVGADAIDTGANGHPRGWPCILYVNGEFYGIGDLLYNSSRKDYNIPKNKPKKIMVIWDGAISIPDISPTSSGITIDSPSTITDETTECFTKWQTFAKSSQADFTSNIGTYLDKRNVIDFYVFLCFINAPDCVQKNTTFITWDGAKWFFMPYDLDTTFGLHYAGTSIAYSPTLNLFDNGLASAVNRTFWNKVRTAYKDDMDARYAELRNLGVFSQDMVFTLARNYLSRYSPEMFEAEYAKWPAVPSLNITSIDQIMSYTAERLAYLDSFFSYNP